MSKWNREPEWIPQDTEGNDWRFISWNGRHLGRVYGAVGGFYLSEKFCCHTVHEHTTMESAAARVETTLYCTECKRSCLPASN